jgi:hypothetical protein
MRAHRELTAERLRELLGYDTLTETFRWKPRQARNGDWHHKIFNKRYAGKRAGCSDIHGYIQIRVDRRDYKAHRLAWLWVHGTLPADRGIDHRDRNPANNAIRNLRLATRQQQACNTGARKPGHSKGHHWSRRDKKWSAWIYINARKLSLGLSGAWRTPRLLALRLRQSNMVNGPTPQIPGGGPRHDRHC